jgi:amino acid transporter
MVLGGLIMAVISANYAYLMNVYPSAGGAYTYASETLGIVLKQHREESENGGAPTP